jgi:tRNA dimethylallyltransferase
MDIGTDKPGPAERRRAPHHLIDFLDPDQPYSLAEYQARAYRAIDGIIVRGRPALLVGGSGQYIRAVTEGWQPAAGKSRPGLRHWLETWGGAIGPAALHQKLTRLDPKAADEIDYRNFRRTVRALEVVLTTGKRFSEIGRRAEPRYETLLIGLSRPRQALYARIDARVEAMFAAGLVEETQRLLDKGYDADLPSMSAIGYAQTAAYLRGEIDMETTKSLIRRKTRVLVRRQASWFPQDDPRIHWFPAENAPIGQIENAIRGFYLIDD